VQDRRVKVAALAGGVGAGKFLRGVVRAVPPEDLTVIVNTGDDLAVHGLWVSPDLDSILYWLAGLMDRERGWGRGEETFRASGELRRLGAKGAWFGLGDLDLATHLLRTTWLAGGHTLSESTAELSRRFGVRACILPMSDETVTTRMTVLGTDGQAIDLHFQEYWVERAGLDEVKAIEYRGAEESAPAPGVLEAIAEAGVVLVCPSNPIASIDPILAVPGIREAMSERRSIVAGVSPIVGGAPLRGMADRLLPAAGVEVSAVGVAGHYEGLIGGWVIDRVDAALVSRVEALGVRVAVTDTIMTDDEAAESLARAALSLAEARIGP
jgi:LPPG:FO 2-phospho-L-lactate transferase